LATVLKETSTTEDLLVSLKEYIGSYLRDDLKLIDSIKSGLPDIRDSLPCCYILPVMESVMKIYNGGIYDMEWNFRIDLINKAYKIEDVREGLKVRLQKLKELFSTHHLGWNLVKNDSVQIFTYETGREILGVAESEQNEYTQEAVLPITLRGYHTVQNIVVPNVVEETTYIELLDYFMERSKSNFPIYETFWRDVSKPTSLNGLPALGIFFQEPDEEQETRTSTQLTDLPIIFRVYSSLATREIAFINHLRNLHNIKDWILRHPSLEGQVENLMLTSIDYGVENLNIPFKSRVKDVPVFRSDITTLCTLHKYKHT
jgi:hypothetical protein